MCHTCEIHLTDDCIAMAKIDTRRVMLQVLCFVNDHIINSVSVITIQDKILLRIHVMNFLFDYWLHLLNHDPRKIIADPFYSYNRPCKQTLLLVTGTYSYILKAEDIRKYSSCHVYGVLSERHR